MVKKFFAKSVDILMNMFFNYSTEVDPYLSFKENFCGFNQVKGVKFFFLFLFWHPLTETHEVSYSLFPHLLFLAFRMILQSFFSQCLGKFIFPVSSIFYFKLSMRQHTFNVC